MQKKQEMQPCFELDGMQYHTSQCLGEALTPSFLTVVLVNNASFQVFGNV